MIQSILFFVLGFLCAGFIALMIAPAFWRRAEMLTKRRIEATVPLSAAEIQADRDRLRAEFAMSTRRLEMNLKSLGDKATAQMIEIERGRAEMRRLDAGTADTQKAMAQSEARNAELGAELERREDRIRELADRLAEAERLLEQRALEFEKLGRMYDEAMLVSSNRQIELVARESDVDRLNLDMSAMRKQTKDHERRMLEAAAEGRKAREALKVETKKVGDLEKKVERLMTSLADHEERLDRRERELARRRKGDAAEDGVNPSGEARQSALSSVGGEDARTMVEKLKEDRDRLEARLMALTRSNRRLRTDLAAQGRGEEPEEELRENAQLREDIHELAAEMVNMTAAQEGPDSPIRVALAARQDEPRPDQHDKITSLAERVAALQKAVSPN
ncbi:hypothetical protein MesoLjLc_32390 [Mesorhizobium sp. L-8-10]|uniref:hypothetical protein n=1 Tax=unclassified Mesorhizobium TaxID=325217 RepID=UPI0019281279|nr:MULTISPECIES: hypothetical protein [unclassified Mesorhizobium]BCH23575.1 hypothetical protein MesoLjLb_33600 [Mesorhizobium sp. L-8-3]BCH31309.1 hypothetical protein MesoLjLc_32390 [Mesorhizobium sp. L-8-10]